MNIEDLYLDAIKENTLSDKDIGLISDAIASIRSTIIFSPRDWAADVRDAWVYGIVVGWDDPSIKELSSKFGWEIKEIKKMKQLHNALKKLGCWSLAKDK
jgi:hypothetical protein